MHKYTKLSDQRQLGIAMKGLMGVNCLSGKSAFNGMQSCNHHLQFWQNAITSSSSDQCHSDQCKGGRMLPGPTSKTQWDQLGYSCSNRCWLFLMEAGFFTSTFSHGG